MSMHHTFSCDMCRTIYPRGDSSLVPVYWKYSNEATRDVLGTSASWHDVHHHLCVKCIADVAEIAKKVFK